MLDFILGYHYYLGCKQTLCSRHQQGFIWLLAHDGIPPAHHTLSRHYPLLCGTMLRMTHRLSYILPLGLALLVGCASLKGGRKSAAMPGTWQATPIVVDGDSRDWPSPYPNYDAKAKVGYATSNDQQNLYITMQAGDELTQMKMLKQGVTVTIDTTGRKDNGLLINYPLPTEKDLFDMAAMGGTQRREGSSISARHMQQKINKSVAEANQFSIEGWPSCNGGYLATQQASCGIKVSLRMDEYNQLVWEAVVPFRALYGTDTITAAWAGRHISVCFEVKSFRNTSTKAASSASPGMNNTMPGGPAAGGGMRNSMAGGQSSLPGRGPADPLAHLYEHSKTWKQFSLAWRK